MSPAASSSHVVEGDPSSWKTSYVENATNIFNKDVPVCVKGESTERIEDLTIRILMGLNKQKQSKASFFLLFGSRIHPHESGRRRAFTPSSFLCCSIMAPSRVLGDAVARRHPHATPAV